MIRTSTVQLTTISAVAYRQKLVSGGAGITIWGNNVRQPGLASISKTSGEAIPTANTPLEYYPPEAFAEAIKLTAGLPYKNLGKVQMPEGLAVEPEEAEDAPAQPEIEAVIDSAEYQRVVDAYSDKDGRLSYRKRKGLFRFLKRPAITVSFSEIMMPDRSLTPRKAQAELRNHAFAFMEAVSGSKDQICYIRYEYKPKTDTGVPREAEGKEHAV